MGVVNGVSGAIGEEGVDRFMILSPFGFWRAHLRIQVPHVHRRVLVAIGGVLPQQVAPRTRRDAPACSTHDKQRTQESA
jgi:hypothetical protein